MGNNKILAMMEVFKSEINALNAEVNELKLQNQELKQNMSQMQMQSVQKQTQRRNVMPPIATNRLQQIKIAPPSSSSNSSYRSQQQQQQQQMNTLNPPKSIRISKSLRKLKIKKRQNSARNHRNHQDFEKPDFSQKPKIKKAAIKSSNCHSSSADAFVERLSELEGVNEDIEHQRIECRGCGRKFIQSALERHAKICKKVFQSKRKKFNIERVGKDAKSAQGSGGCDEYKLQKMRKKKKQSWKAKSSMLRDAIRASKGYDEAVKSGQPVSNIPYQSSTFDDRVECPHCNRRFNEQAAERHIPKCRDIRA